MNKHLLALIPLTAALLVACGPKTTEVEPGTSSGTPTSSSSVLTSSSIALSSGVPLSSSVPLSSGVVASSSATTSSTGSSATSSTGTSSAGTSSVTVSSAGTSNVVTSSTTTSSTTTTSSSATTTTSSSWNPFKASLTYGTLTDTRGGVTRVYKTIVIGGRTWMAENLDYGTQISASSTQAAGGAAQKYCYQNDATNCVKYGGLYQWATAMALDASCNTSSCTGVTNQQGLCPVDWHIPTLADLGVLYLGTTTSGPHLQSQIGWEGWEGDNSTGFSALPGGIHDPVDGWVLGWDYYSSGTFSGIASFISAAETAGAPLKASVRVVTISSYWGGDYSKMTANSIRCVKNTP